MSWEILDTGIKTATENMEKDRQLLEEIEKLERPLLHLYSWQGDCATYGHFIRPEQLLQMEGVERRQLSLARRPTGGGIIFHVWDLAFSALVPATWHEYSLNTLDNYALINRKVIQAVEEFRGLRLEAHLLPLEPIPLDAASQNFCMAKPTKYDVVTRDGRKIGGAAQRRTRGGFLHQATISLVQPPADYLEEVLQPQTRVVEAMRQNSFTLIEGSWSQRELDEARQEIKSLLIKAVTE
jgi:lipoate---protein ligase